MAYVEPRRATHDAAVAIVRNGARTAAIAGYATAVLIAMLLLAPVLFTGGDEGPALPAGPQPVQYTVKPGESLAGIAGRHGLSLERFFALNRGVTPLGNETGKRLVVGWR